MTIAKRFQRPLTGLFLPGIELTGRNLPTERVKESLETLQIYSVLTREDNSYHFTFREFGKLMEENSDMAELLEEEIAEVENGNL